MIQLYFLFTVELEIIYLHLFLNFLFYKIILLVLLLLLWYWAPNPHPLLSTSQIYCKRKIKWKIYVNMLNQNIVLSLNPGNTKKIFVHIHICYVCIYVVDVEIIITTSETESKFSVPILFSTNSPFLACFWYSFQLFISLFVTSKTPVTGQRATFLNFWGAWSDYFVICDIFFCFPFCVKKKCSLEFEIGNSESHNYTNCSVKCKKEIYNFLGILWLCYLYYFLFEASSKRFVILLALSAQVIQLCKL